MTGKEILMAALRGERTPRVPVAPHWWGLWKYEALGLPLPQAAWRDGEALSAVYTRVHDHFRPDWIHLHIGTPRWFRDARIEPVSSTPGAVGRLGIDERYRSLKAADRYFSVECGEDEMITDFQDYLLGSRVLRPKVDLTSKQRVDGYVKRYVTMTAREIRDQGYTDHIEPVLLACGEKSLVAVHIPSAVCEIFDPFTGYVGFEEGLMAFHDQPEGMRRLIEGCYHAQLEWARAYAAAGAHAFVISESYISPDLADPSIYRGYLKGVHGEYFREVERMGLIPMCHFWGDVRPVLEDLTQIGLRGLLIEESKKGFDLDPALLRRKLDGRVCLFGNLDTLGLLHDGSPDQVRRAAEAMATGVDRGFVVANGSPITPGTPAANVRALIGAATGTGG